MLSKHDTGPRRNFSSGIIPIPVLVLVLIASSVVASANIKTSNDVATVKPVAVLGDDDRSGKSSGEKSEDSKNEDEDDDENNEDKQSTENETINTTSGRSEDKKSEVKFRSRTEKGRQETEIETESGEKIKTKVEDGVTTKVEVERGQLKLKYVFENGTFKLKVENEAGEDVDLDEDELEEVENEVEDELEDDDIEIATESGRPVFSRRGIPAVTDFPLSIDVGTNSLIVTTPAGQKVVTVLPDEAVANLLATGIVNRVDGLPTDATESAQLDNLTQSIKLEIKDDKVVYKIKGVRDHRLIGFIPVSTNTTAFVSAESGEVVSQEQSILARIIDILSL